VQLYRYFVSQSVEFWRHNPLCCFSTSVYCCKRILRYRLSPETFGYTLVYWPSQRFLFYMTWRYWHLRHKVLSCVQGLYANSPLGLESPTSRQSLKILRNNTTRVIRVSNPRRVYKTDDYVDKTNRAAKLATITSRVRVVNPRRNGHGDLGAAYITGSLQDSEQRGDCFITHFI
jgi:hypothetical protein